MELDLSCQRSVNWLLLPALKRKANCATDSVESIGRSVITQALRDRGISTGYLGIGERPPSNSVVLVSLTSSFDVAALYASGVDELKRLRQDLTIIVGGPGVQNPFALGAVAHYAFLGRGESAIADIVQMVLAGLIPQHQSLVDTSAMNSAVYQQTTDLWPGRIRLSSVSRYWVEDFVGCPHLCAYCHYSYARRFKGRAKDYHQGALTPSNPEIRLDAVAQSQARRLRTSIDGCSERIRYAFGKRISDGDISLAIEALNDRHGTMMAIYNIGNAPSEGDEDRSHLDDVLRFAASRCKQTRKRLNVLIQTTPFRPSPLTPLAIAPASLWPNWHDRASEVVADTPGALIQHSFGNESPKSHLTSLAVERHDGSVNACSTLRLVASAAFQRASVTDALAMISAGEIDRLCRAYTWADLPTARWTSWVDPRTIARRSSRIQSLLGW